ncbi:hypothetical protein POM88_025997 [Heracleum sosnowskyi]|uniref:Uncharacterized protein n=1 Tax=Heracleum sosnowskyi TaxID=360622 RepID=A0AAD8I5M2_9APIA|nr:hypothetical protein POM88_025997 [Heracleum sosnowskyi]
MSELPFGENPFADTVVVEKIPPSQSQATPSVILAQPAPQVREKEKNARKRHADVVNLEKGEPNKKGKQTVDAPVSMVGSQYGDIAALNLKEEDMKLWYSRSHSETCASFKQALGETFFHGMGYVTELEGENRKLEKTLCNTKDVVTYYKSQLNDSEKKVFNLGESHKSKISILQQSLDEAKGSLKT